MNLSPKEIDELIVKLREQYIEYSKKVSDKMFDRDSFETRLKMAINNKTRMGLLSQKNLIFSFFLNANSVG